MKYINAAVFCAIAVAWVAVRDAVGWDSLHSSQSPR